MKKSLIFAVIIAMLAAVSCSDSTKNPDSSQTAEEMTEVSQTIYQEEKLRLDLSIDEPAAVKMCENGCLFFYKSRNSETNIQEIRLATLDGDFNLKSDILLKDTAYLDFTVNINIDGSFDLVYLDSDFEFEYDNFGNVSNMGDFNSKGDFRIMLAHYDSSGELTAENELIGLNNEYGKRSSRFCGLCPYGEGKMILSYGNGAAIIGEDGSVFDTAYYDMQLVDLGCDSDGNVIASSHSSFGYMDGETLTLPEKYMNPNGELLGLESQAIEGDDGFKAYFKKQDGIYGLTADDELKLVFDFSDSLVSDFGCFDSCGGGVFVSGNYISRNLIKYNRRADDYKNERETVDIWYIAGGDDGKRAIDFSKANDKFLGKVNPELKSPQQLTEAVLTGNAPDVVEIHETDTLNKLLNLGAAADMRELMNEYGGFSFDDLMPNVVQAFDMDGKIYALPYEFAIEEIIANSDYIGKENVNWTYDNLYKFFDERPDDMVLFNTWHDKPLGRLCTDNIEAWIDTKNNTCNFDSPEFIKLLEFCKENSDSNLPEPEWTEDGWLIYEKQHYKAMPEHQVMLGGSTPDFGLSSYLEDIGEMGLDFDSASIINLPNSGGQMVAQHSMVVMENSDCKEGAWAYVTYMLTDYQFDLSEELDRCVNFTNKEAFEKSFAKGIYTSGEPRMGSMHHGNSGFSVEFPIQITQKQADEYKDFLMNCTKLKYENSDISNIIYEEFNSYMNGEITVEQCAEHIQNRAELVISEQQ